MKRFLACSVASIVAVASVLVVGAGGGPAGAQTPPVVPVPYVGVTPVRVLEPVVSGVGGGPMAMGDERTLTVTGIGTVPAEVEAVDLTVTGVRNASGVARLFISTGGTATTSPALSVRNVGGRQTATVTVAPSATGEIRVRAGSALDVQIDVRGYFAVDAGFTAPDAPTPVLVTGSGLGGGDLVANETREVGVLGIGDVPADGVSAIMGRVVVNGTTEPGLVRVAPAGAPSTAGEALRVNNGSERVSSVIVGLGRDGKVQVRASVDADVTFLVDGWFDESRGFTPVVPTTVVDNLLVQPGGIRTAASGAVLPDSGVAAVAVQVVATGTTTVGSFSLRAATGQETPAMSVGGPTGMARGGSAVWTPVRSDGTFDIALSSGMPATRATVTVVGWTAAATVGTDTTEPTASVESPTPGALDASESGSFTMVVAAADAGSDVAAVDVTVAGVTTAARYQIVGTDYRWVAEVLAAESGLRDYVVDIVDRAGNVRTITATYTLTAPGEEDTVLDPDTTVVDETVGELTAYDPGTGVMVFDGDVSDTMRPGQILASDPTTLAPNGYLRVITGVSRTGSTTTVHSRQALITEAVRRASFDLSLPPQGGAQNRSFEFDDNWSFTKGLAVTETFGGGAFTSTFELSGGVTLSVGLHIVLEIDFGLTHWPRVEHFEAVAEASVTVNASETITGEFDKGSLPANELLATYPLGVIATPIIGVVITPALELRNDWHVNVAGALSAGFTTGRRFQVGVVYDGESWEPVAEEGTIGGGFQIEQEASAEFLAELGLAVRLNVSVNDTVGVYLQGRIGLEISGSWSTSSGFECGARLVLSVEVGSDIQIPVLGISIAEFVFGDTTLGESELFNISCPGGEPVETSVEGTEAWVGEQEVLSVSPEGDPGDLGGGAGPASPGATIVAFASRSTNLLPGLTTDRGRAYVRNTVTDTTELISVGLGGTDPNGVSSPVDVSRTGRYVLFNSTSSNLVSGLTTTGPWRLYLYDRETDTTELLVGHPGDPCTYGIGDPANAQMSDDVRYVMFQSDDPCVAGDTNGAADVFVLDRVTDVVERVSVDAAGGQISTGGGTGALSGDGRYASFTSGSGLIDPVVAPAGGVFRRDRTAGSTEVVSYEWGGEEVPLVQNRMDRSGHRFVGRKEALHGLCLAYLVDMQAGTTEQVDSDCAGGDSLDLSGDGRYVSFAGTTTSLVIDTEDDSTTTCPGGGSVLSDDGRWITGGAWLGDPAAFQATRTRCR